MEDDAFKNLMDTEVSLKLTIGEIAAAGGCTHLVKSMYPHIKMSDRDLENSTNFIIKVIKQVRTQVNSDPNMFIDMMEAMMQKYPDIVESTAKAESMGNSYDQENLEYIDLSPEEVIEFKKVYQEAVENDEVDFQFKQKTFLTSYAKYLIDYLNDLPSR